MPAATQALIDEFNLEMSIYKSQMLALYNALTTATINKNMKTLLYNNNLASEKALLDSAGDTEVARLKALYGTNGTAPELSLIRSDPNINSGSWARDAGIENFIKYLKDKTDLTLATKSDPQLGTIYSVLNPPGEGWLANPVSPTMKYPYGNFMEQGGVIYWNLNGINLRPVYVAFWKEANKSVANIFNANQRYQNFVQSKLDADAAYTKAVNDQDANKAQVNAWLSTYTVYPNLNVPTYDQILNDAINPPPPPAPVIVQTPVSDLESFPKVIDTTIAPVPVPTIQPPTTIQVAPPATQPATLTVNTPTQSVVVPVQPLPETPLRAVDATKISNETGPSQQIKAASITQNIQAAPKNNSTLLMAGAAALATYMFMKRKK